MNSSKAISLGVVALVLGLVILSGCTQQNTTNPTDNGTIQNTTPTDQDSSGNTYASSDTYASELVGGTGSGSGDISTSDLDGMDQDLDELDEGTDSMDESNI